MRALIVGGGVIGTSIAYYLAAGLADVIVIERRAIGCAASGKSGGFLAMDWCDGTPLMHLARRSFALHAELAEGRAVEWGYRRMTTYGGIVGGRLPLRLAEQGPDGCRRTSRSTANSDPRAPQHRCNLPPLRPG
jgi:hypothetical protein